jgi:hypothetical protein
VAFLDEKIAIVGVGATDFAAMYEVAFVPAREGTWLPVFRERHDA